LRKGHRKASRFKALECDTLFEKDVAITLRDGIKIYADIFRPVAETKKCPVILAWSPYGKHLCNDTMLEAIPERVGVKASDLSGYEDFEGPDPGFFVPRGYAVVNVDVRGSWHSEGNMHFWGKQDEYDGYDVIEYLGKLSWSNGKVGLAGNSWLAIAQWFIASGSPPCLAAIAPWEGLSDGYRDQHRRGGIPSRAMPSSLGLMVPSLGLQEDAGIMAERNPLWNQYWQDKRPDFKRIKVPTYVVASYSSKIHSAGSFRAFANIAAKEKWLRVHSTQEWFDFVDQKDDLLKFFDYFLKGIKNDWPSTPRVRCSILRFNAPAIENVPFSEYPPKNSLACTYFLDAALRTLTKRPPEKTSSCSYVASGEDQIDFLALFEEETTLVGYPSIQLHVSCQEHVDMDVWVVIRKLDKHKKPLLHVNFPTSTPLEKIPKLNPVLHQGPTGCIRASHREIAESDEVGSGEFFHPHCREQPVPRGERVKLQFHTWPIGMKFEAGEYLQLCVGGKDFCFVESEVLPVEKNHNKGSHTIHSGGQYDSLVKLPILQS
jgi:predicted acyl esterase